MSQPIIACDCLAYRRSDCRAGYANCGAMQDVGADHPRLAVGPGLAWGALLVAAFAVGVALAGCSAPPKPSARMPKACRVNPDTLRCMTRREIRAADRAWDDFGRKGSR